MKKRRAKTVFLLQTRYIALEQEIRFKRIRFDSAKLNDDDHRALWTFEGRIYYRIGAGHCRIRSKETITIRWFIHNNSERTSSLWGVSGHARWTLADRLDDYSWFHWLTKRSTSSSLVNVLLVRLPDWLERPDQSSGWANHVTSLDRMSPAIRQLTFKMSPQWAIQGETMSPASTVEFNSNGKPRLTRTTQQNPSNQLYCDQFKRLVTDCLPSFHYQLNSRDIVSSTAIRRDNECCRWSSGLSSKRCVFLRLESRNCNDLNQMGRFRASNGFSLALPFGGSFRRKITSFRLFAQSAHRVPWRECVVLGNFVHCSPVEGVIVASVGR